MRELSPKRIHTTAISFWDAPGDRIATAYRKLEDRVRKRIDSDQHGRKLFSEAFLGKAPKLGWPGIPEGESVGRANIFIGVFGAYRNPRAHRELPDPYDDVLSEFLLVNQLFRFEREAVETQPKSDA